MIPSLPKATQRVRAVMSANYAMFVQASAAVVGIDKGLNARSGQV